ncbi:MAG: hypothetical protein C5B49_03640 [Bdellovibrio sp.]|nr:MAG: hypothetical protein C5B49_03640 [Bdellovibrio sp.]
MGKQNPLFVDSTLHPGDGIRCLFEVRQVLLYEEESIYLVLLNTDGEESYAEMSEAGTHYEATVRLMHELPIHFYFAIVKDEKLLFRSQIVQRTPRYTLVENWEPVVDSRARILFGGGSPGAGGSENPESSSSPEAMDEPPPQQPTDSFNWEECVV